MSQSGKSPVLSWNADYLDQFESFLFDCDGVLWLGSKVIEGAVDAVNALQAMGKQVFFVTNNSTKSRKQFQEILTQKGFKGVEHCHVLSSAFAAAEMLLASCVKHDKEDSKVHTSPAHFDPRSHKALVVGGVGILHELEEAGISHISANEIIGGDGHWSRSQLETHEIDPQVRAVIVGLDERFTYSKAALATLYLQAQPAEPTFAKDDFSNPDASSPSTTCRSPYPVMFIGTNCDVTYPVANRLLPGAGSCVGMISKAANRCPVDCGKPNPLMIDLAIQRFGLDPKRTLMIGDRLDTDIAFGMRAGIKTLMVLTGVNVEADIHAEDNDIVPDFILPSVAQIHHKA